MKGYVQYFGSVLEVPTIKDLLLSTSSGKQMHTVLKGVIRRKRNINNEKKKETRGKF